MTTTAVQVRGLSKAYGGVHALDDVSFSVEEGVICGLLGRNGAGKTTALQVITGHALPTSGSVEVFGRRPFEDRAAMASMCFVKEGQRYPEDFTVGHVLASGADLLPGWDADFADRLLDRFELPPRRRVKKLSRGMTSALGIVLGLASRAPLTVFDEPYLGLDAAARQIFYDELLADYAERPRTVLLSTHLIDEVADLLERVVVIDRGRVLMDDSVENLRQGAVVATGPSHAVERLMADATVLSRDELGEQARIAGTGRWTADELSGARAAGISVEPASLQQLVVGATGK